MGEIFWKIFFGRKMVQLVKKMPPKALGRVFWWFLIIFGHVFFGRFLVYFFLIFGPLEGLGDPWKCLKMALNCSKNIKGTIFWLFLTILDGFGVVLGRFGEWYFFFLFWSFLRCFLEQKWPLKGLPLVLLVLFWSCWSYFQKKKKLIFFFENRTTRTNGRPFNVHFF